MTRRSMVGRSAMALVLAAHAVAAQSVPTLELGKRTGRTPYSFGYVVAAVGLADGRALVADRKEAAFRMVNFATGDMSVIGEPGEGPLGYRGAHHIFARGDSLLLLDGRSHVMLHATGDGLIVSRTDFSFVFDNTEQAIIFGPVAIDPSGALYYILKKGDSLFNDYPLNNVVRVSADGKNRKVVDYLSTRRPEQMRASRGAVVPFLYHDSWALRADGLAARIVADSYQVVWSRDGHETGRTGLLPTSPIPVTDAEQVAFRDSIIDRWNPKPAADGSGPAGGGGGPTGLVRPSGSASTGDNTPRSFTPTAATATLRIPELTPFPQYKAAIPYEIGDWSAGQFDKNGALWIARERAHSDNIPHMDVVVEGRGLVMRVNLPKNTRLAGFGPDCVYLVNHDNNGDWLERYPMPRT